MLQRFALALLQLSLAAALIATVTLKPYTVDAPKKILLQHLHVQVRSLQVSSDIKLIGSLVTRSHHNACFA